MKKWMVLAMALLMVPFAALGEGFDLATEARQVCTEMTTGQYDAIVEKSNETVRAVVTADMLAQSWEMLAGMVGAFEEVSSEQLQTPAKTAIFELHFEKGDVRLFVSFDDQGRISNLGMQPLSKYEATPRDLPEGARETDVTLFEGTEKALPGKIVAPEGDVKAYVVFVHGSGPCDMDESAGPNRVFRDMAFDLAENGVGSLRFDKITYAHPELLVQTVEQEYLLPVREAYRVMKENAGDAKIYMAGHSEGGILTPWLVSECGFDGGVALAGTPKALWEMSYDQNLLSIAGMPEDQRETLLAQVEAEKARALTIKDMTAEEAKGQTVFGMDAVYLRHMALLDEIAIAKETGKPFLFLWGEDDFQVNKSAYEAWKEGLGEGALYAYVTYPGLNHMFLKAEAGDSLFNAQAAYSRPGFADPAVGRDIATWIAGLGA